MAQPTSRNFASWVALLCQCCRATHVTSRHWQSSATHERCARCPWCLCGSRVGSGRYRWRAGRGLRTSSFSTACQIVQDDRTVTLPARDGSCHFQTSLLAGLYSTICTPLLLSLVRLLSCFRASVTPGGGQYTNAHAARHSPPSVDRLWDSRHVANPA